MKRLVTTAALAVAVLASAHGQARAHGGYGFGFGVGVGVNFSGWTFNPCNSCGSCSTGCCIIPGWSPVYAPPKMGGGLQALQAQCYGAGYGAYPNGGHYYPGANAASPADKKDEKKDEKKEAGKPAGKEGEK
jgi:hypothetical protein